MNEKGNELALSTPDLGSSLPSVLATPNSQNSRIVTASVAIATAMTRVTDLDIDDSECKALMANFQDAEVEILPQGHVYIPHILIRNRLNEVLGIGQWALILRDYKIDDKVLLAEYVLVVRGAYVGQTIIQSVYYKNGQTTLADKLEGMEGDAIRRLAAKKLSCGTQVWDHNYQREWLKNFAVCVWAENVKTGTDQGKKKKLWRRADDENKFTYPLKETSIIKNAERPTLEGETGHEMTSEEVPDAPEAAVTAADIQDDAEKRQENAKSEVSKKKASSKKTSKKKASSKKEPPAPKTVSLSPMAKAWKKLSKDIPEDGLLCIHHGGAYAFFYEHAARASEVLGIVVEDLDGSSACQVPVGLSKDSFTKLVESGLKVFLYETKEVGVIEFLIMEEPTSEDTSNKDLVEIIGPSGIAVGAGPTNHFNEQGFATPEYEEFILVCLQSAIEGSLTMDMLNESLGCNSGEWTQTEKDQALDIYHQFMPMIDDGDTEAVKAHLSISFPGYYA